MDAVVVVGLEGVAVVAEGAEVGVAGVVGVGVGLVVVEFEPALVGAGSVGAFPVGCFGGGVAEFGWDVAAGGCDGGDVSAVLDEVADGGFAEEVVRSGDVDGPDSDDFGDFALGGVSSA